MSTESELVEKIARLDNNIRTGRDILRQWNEYELYPGQFLKQANFVKLLAEKGLIGVEE